MTELPKGWTEVALGELARFVNGAAFKESDWGDAGYRIIRIQNLTDPEKSYNHTKRRVKDDLYVEPGDLLVSWSATLGVFQWAGPDVAVLNQHIFRVIPNHPDLDRQFLGHLLRSAVRSMERHTHGATMKHINRGGFLGTSVPLPPLEEQRRIAAILDKANELRAKRRAALEKLDSLTQAIFLDMLSEHPDSPFVSVESVAASERGAIRTGPFGSQLLHSEFVDEGVRVLGIDNVVANEFRWAEPRHITPEKYETLHRFTVHPGDVLVTIMGTCGRTAVAPDDIPVAINTKHLCCITVDRTRVEPRWLHAALLHDRRTRRQLGERAKGAVMPGLNMGLIKSVKVPMPPLALQQQFVARLEPVEQLKSDASQGSADLDSLFASLQSRAFRGEL